VACEPLDRQIREAQKQGRPDPLSAEERAFWERKEALRRQVIQVDDFPQDFGRSELVRREEKAFSVKAA
jgi:hypothetical protein